MATRWTGHQRDKPWATGQYMQLHVHEHTYMVSQWEGL